MSNTVAAAPASSSSPRARRGTFILALTVAVLAVLAMCMATLSRVDDIENGSESATGPDPRHTAAEAAPEPRKNDSFGADHLRFTDGRMWLRAAARPLHQLTEELQRETGIEIYFDPRIGDDLVSANISGQPLLDALAGLFSQYDLVVKHRAYTGTSYPSSMWLYPQRSGVSPQIPSDKASHDQLGDSSTPSNAAPAFSTDVTAEQLSDAMRDDSKVVRHLALATSLEADIEIDADTLRHVATSDPDSSIRDLALTAMSRSKSAGEALIESTARTALLDVDPLVREHAKSMIEYLEYSRRPNE